MLYIETSFEPELATYANFPDGSMAIELGDKPAAIVPSDVKAPVVGLMVYIETLTPGEASELGSPSAT